MKPISNNKGIIYCKKTIIGDEKIRFKKGSEYDYTIHRSGAMSVINLKQLYSIQCASVQKFFQNKGEYFESKGERRKRKIKEMFNV